jgi:hypothetical protein
MIVASVSPIRSSDVKATGKPPGLQLDPSRIFWKPADPSSWSKTGQGNVIQKIMKIEQDLRKISSKRKDLPLDASQIRDIGDFFGRNGRFTGHDGVTYLGGNDITQYFSHPERNFSNVQFRLELVFAEEFSWNDPDDPRGDKTDPLHPIYYILSCSFDLNGTFYDPPGSGNCIHIRACDCINQ